jgi:hypothetical protein
MGKKHSRQAATGRAGSASQLRIVEDAVAVLALQGAIRGQGGHARVAAAAEGRGQHVGE